jgi:hypothetical protein
MSFVDFFIQQIFILQSDKNRIEEEFNFEELSTSSDITNKTQLSNLVSTTHFVFHILLNSKKDKISWSDKNRIEEEFNFEELQILRDLAYRKVKEQGALFKVRQLWKIHYYLNDLLNCCTFIRKFYLF